MRPLPNFKNKKNFTVEFPPPHVVSVLKLASGSFGYIYLRNIMSSSLTPRSIHSYFGEPNPLYKAPSIVETCSAKQLEAIKQLKTKCEAWIPELAPEEKAFMTNEGDLLYFRYLAGYGWEKLKDAEEGLKQTCKWRAETKPQNLKFEDLGDVGKSGFVFHYGYDKMNRPIVYIGTYQVHLIYFCRYEEGHNTHDKGKYSFEIHDVCLLYRTTHQENARKCLSNQLDFGCFRSQCFTFSRKTNEGYILGPRNLLL